MNCKGRNENGRAPGSEAVIRPTAGFEERFTYSSGLSAGGDFKVCISSVHRGKKYEEKSEGNTEMKGNTVKNMKEIWRET